MSTEILYKVLSGSGNTVEEATEILKKIVKHERSNGWTPLGDIVVLEKSRNNSFSIIQVVTNDQNSK